MQISTLNIARPANCCLSAPESYDKKLDLPSDAEVAVDEFLPKH